MSIYYLHHNENVFPSSHTFDPSRWLSDPITGRPPLGPDDEKLLTRYLNPFSRGTRQCLGMHLAYAEMYICLANLFRGCRIELFETSEMDVKMHSEQFLALPHPDSKGVRVLIR
jgi:cytochrome P450